MNKGPHIFITHWVPLFPFNRVILLALHCHLLPSLTYSSCHWNTPPNLYYTDYCLPGQVPPSYFNDLGPSLRSLSLSLAILPTHCYTCCYFLASPSTPWALSFVSASPALACSHVSQHVLTPFSQLRLWSSKHPPFICLLLHSVKFTRYMSFLLLHNKLPQNK